MSIVVHAWSTCNLGGEKFTAECLLDSKRCTCPRGLLRNILKGTQKPLAKTQNEQVLELYKIDNFAVTYSTNLLLENFLIIILN